MLCMRRFVALLAVRMICEPLDEKSFNAPRSALEKQHSLAQSAKQRTHKKQENDEYIVIVR